MIRDGAVVHEAVYPHPVRRVWRALVEPAELAEWLMPSQGFAPVVGQRFTMACDPFGEIEAEVLECEPPRRLLLRWNAAFGVTEVCFTLSPAGNGTRLTLIHRGWDDSAAAIRDQFGSGWDGKLGERLLALLHRVPGSAA